jgi:hypothetical protein
MLLAAVLLVVFLSMASCVGCLVVGARAAKEGVPYVSETIRAVAKPWDPEALISRSSPEFLGVMPGEKTRSFIAFVRTRLGDLKECTSVQEGQWISNLSTRGFAVLATYFADCQFDKAAARVTLQVVRRHGQWKVNGFFLNSDALMSDPSPSPPNVRR